jgi:propanol-preferring alcohol dehydrogenase
MDFSTPDVNKAAIYVEPGVSLKTEVIERPIETPGPGDVLVRL